MDPTIGDFNVSAEVLTDNGQMTTFTHKKIADGDARISLVSPRIYTAMLTVNFTGPANATVTLKARVVKPAGGVHGAPFSESITGKNPRVEKAALLAVTRK
jgi:hypothetical protein